MPYLSHATMEPMCATARITQGRLEVWAGTQDPLSSRRVAARAADLDESDVVIHNQQLGGGFGRRLPGTLRLHRAGGGGRQDHVTARGEARVEP